MPEIVFRVMEVKLALARRQTTARLPKLPFLKNQLHLRAAERMVATLFRKKGGVKFEPASLFAVPESCSAELLNYDCCKN